MTPAAALAKALVADHACRVEIMTDSRGMKYKDMFGDEPMHPLPSAAMGTGLVNKLIAVLKLALGALSAWVTFMKCRPDCVVGFGGYPSVPAVFAAQLLKIPTILHEQNAIIGKANAFLAKSATYLAASLDGMKGAEHYGQDKIVVTGNPVRPDIEALKDQPYPDFTDKSPLNLVVVGGSLGATVLSEVVPLALKSLPSDYKARLRVVQQCRETDLDLTAALYEDSGVDVSLCSFIDDMAAQIEKAHLLICRSGASTVSELTLAGRPAIYVPYPYHKDQQQKRNAESVADHGGAWVMTEKSFTAQALQNRLELLFQSPETLVNAAEKSRACGIANAAEKLAALVLQTARPAAERSPV